MQPLDNPSENTCFGCGPTHARGLRLSFARDGDSVVCEHTPKADETGWPGLYHTGLHFTTLFEACYWAAWELTGKVHVAHGEQRFDQKRLPRVGAPFRVRARILERNADGPVLVAHSETLDGKPLATLTTMFRTESRARVEKLALPRYITDDMMP